MEGAEDAHVSLVTYGVLVASGKGFGANLSAVTFSFAFLSVIEKIRMLRGPHLVEMM